MSHVVTVKSRFRDVAALRSAFNTLGFDVRESKKYRWYGRSVGDTPLPEGMTKDDLGKCEWEAVLRDAPPNAYTVGIRRQQDGTLGVVFDYWGPGACLAKALGGNDAPKLKQAYAIAVVKAEAAKQGKQCITRKLPSGAMQIVVS